MTDGPVGRPPTRITASRGPARHERPALDALGLEAARHADRMLDGARAAEAAGRREASRWVAYLEPLPEHLRDDEPAALRRTAMRARSAYGAKDSIREVLAPDLTEPFLDALDRLLRELNRTRS
jgi:hypothetical protein